MNLLIVLALAVIATSVSSAMEKKSTKSTKSISFSPTLSQREVVDLEKITQWSHQFPLVGGGSILREDKKGIFVNINKVQTGPDDDFKWLAGITVFGTTPSKDVYLDMYMTQKAFSAALEDAGILMKHST